ncbi:MAG: hypothetical protein AB1640_06210 [bacterium]
MDFSDFAWLIAVLTTGTAAGAMTGHTLLLGRFFNWIFESDRTEVFRQNYPAFMEARKPQRFFDHLFTAALVATTAYAVLLFLTDRIGTMALIAAGLQWLFAAVFFGTGFAGLEQDLFIRGAVSPEKIRRFLSLNTPLIALSSLLLLVSFACLLLMKA